MPTPKEGESKEDFIGRCIPILKDEGKKQDQAIAICYSMWERRNEDVLSKINDYLSEAKNKIISNKIINPSHKHIGWMVHINDKSYEVYEKNQKKAEKEAMKRYKGVKG